MMDTDMYGEFGPVIAAMKTWREGRTREANARADAEKARADAAEARVKELGGQLPRETERADEAEKKSEHATSNLDTAIKQMRGSTKFAQELATRMDAAEARAEHFEGLCGEARKLAEEIRGYSAKDTDFNIAATAFLAKLDAAKPSVPPATGHPDDSTGEFQRVPALATPKPRDIAPPSPETQKDVVRVWMATQQGFFHRLEVNGECFCWLFAFYKSDNSTRWHPEKEYEKALNDRSKLRYIRELHGDEKAAFLKEHPLPTIEPCESTDGGASFHEGQVIQYGTKSPLPEASIQSREFIAAPELDSVAINTAKPAPEVALPKCPNCGWEECRISTRPDYKYHCSNCLLFWGRREVPIPPKPEPKPVVYGLVECDYGDPDLILYGKKHKFLKLVPLEGGK